MIILASRFILICTLPSFISSVFLNVGVLQQGGNISFKDHWGVEFSSNFPPG